MVALGCRNHASTKLLLAYVALVVLLANPVGAPAKDKDKNDAEIKFTSRTELVLIPTLVTDKSGAHIGGLKKEDFTVFENGSERQVATFEEITTDTRRVSRTRSTQEFSNFLDGSGA